MFHTHERRCRNAAAPQLYSAVSTYKPTIGRTESLKIGPLSSPTAEGASPRKLKLEVGMKQISPHSTQPALNRYTLSCTWLAFGPSAAAMIERYRAARSHADGSVQGNMLQPQLSSAWTADEFAAQSDLKNHTSLVYFAASRDLRPAACHLLQHSLLRCELLPLHRGLCQAVWIIVSICTFCTLLDLWTELRPQPAPKIGPCRRLGLGGAKS
jgi:hypothetical protein